MRITAKQETKAFEILDQSMSRITVAADGSALTTLGYSAGRKRTIDVTDLIWKRAHMNGFALAN